MLSYHELLHTNGELKAKLDEAEETLRAIRNGEVDALIVATAQGSEVYTLQGADQPYRVLIEEMHQGAITILVDGTILYSNRCFAEIVSYPLEAMLSGSIYQHFMPEDCQRFTEFIQAAQSLASIDGEFTLRNRQNEPIAVHISANALQLSQLLILGLVVTDLRERKQSEKAIRFQAQLLNTVGQAVVATNVENKVIYWNRFAETLYGWSGAEAIGRNITDLMPSDASLQQAEEIVTRLQSGARWNGEFMVQRKDGTTFPALVTDNPIVDEHGVQIGIIGISMDITDRKRAEAKLAKVNRTLALISGVNQAIVRIRVLSELFETVCRIAVEIGGFHMAWIGLLDAETGQVTPVAHGGIAENYLEMLDIVLDDKPRGQGPTAVALRTGERVIVNDIEHDPLMDPWRKDALRLGYRASAAFPLNVAGEMRGVLNLYAKQVDFFDDEELDQLSEMVSDVSFGMEFAEKEAQRKQAEENLQNLYSELETRITVRTAELQMSKDRVEAILNSSVDAILLLKGDFSIQQTNAAFNNLFACKQDDYFGKSLNVLLDVNDSDSMDRLLQAAAEQSTLAIDVAARRKDGTIFAAELSIGFIRDDSFVCTFHDISERKKIEQSLQMAVAKEKELNELKTRFVSMASHEFRTPLATIHAATETLSAYRHKLTEDQIDLKLSNIRGQVGYLKDIMDDVLKLAQLQMRRVAFKPETVDFDALCREVIDEAQNGTAITHEILYTCASGLPTAQLDKKLMRQLVSNLVSNAIKYSPHDKNVRFNLEYTDQTLVFSVRDSGIGVPKDDLKHLFEPFHRAANVGTMRGTGLGLVIAKESVELHGGTITIESQIGTGTTVTVHIPIKTQRV